ncbi:hypothetical protein A2886_00805 [candidate division WWE3 bacterium RIFCSPHIGHO2_01_FULL_42_13]|uniref:Glycosyl transferase family 1 domain-containing protein n=1 Tax=candidate division WWE3 bacterium RIFCSPHIGHO2_01_FULL_42_13 TaxID=1802617 RepID=A0A1F4UQU6_UNCKA|nr:MAG: hypothetical protein A2886_00805 [candidate division WWE3 bacterium RIFCSPHIGHO2_01_FULL_42_13]
MKVLMWSRVDLFDIGGGDLIQMEATAAELRKLGVEVDISTDLNADLSNYDVIHVFHMDWTAETYSHAKRARDGRKPLVLSPIHHSVKEVKRFDDEYGLGWRKITSFLFPDQHQRDTMKNIYRSLSDHRKLKPTLQSIFMGLKNMHTKTLSMANVVLVQTEAEARDLKETYGVEIKWVKVSNGVGEQFTREQEFENSLGVEDYIICVGRIEARKNQLNIIKAVEKFIASEEIDVSLVFVGKKNTHHGSFIKEFDKKVAENSWIIYVPETSWDEMPALFHFAKVGVSASWFETSGLTSLEALFSGANVVAAGERAREILGNLASYCDPGSVDSIAEAIKKQYDGPKTTVPAEMREEYTWENAARKTKKVYEEVLAKS